VLPIGGLKEKLIAALRGGIKTVVIPRENEKDLKEIPAQITRGLELIPVEHMDEVMVAALSHADVRGFLKTGEHVVEAIFAGAETAAAAAAVTGAAEARIN
jgi:predicted ATP-dependent protease